MARSSRNLDQASSGSLDQLKTSIEASMADALDQYIPDTSETPADHIEAPPVMNHMDQLSRSGPADRLVASCNATATEIQSSGEAVVQVANAIAAETQALAELLRKHGNAIAARIEEFTAMSKRVAEKVQAAREDVLTASGSAPSLSPQAENVNET